MLLIARMMLIIIITITIGPARMQCGGAYPNHAFQTCTPGAEWQAGRD